MEYFSLQMSAQIQKPLLQCLCGFHLQCLMIGIRPCS